MTTNNPNIANTANTAPAFYKATRDQVDFMGVAIRRPFNTEPGAERHVTFTGEALRSLSSLQVLFNKKIAAEKKTLLVRGAFLTEDSLYGFTAVATDSHTIAFTPVRDDVAFRERDRPGVALHIPGEVLCAIKAKTVALEVDGSVMVIVNRDGSRLEFSGCPNCAEQGEELFEKFTHPLKVYAAQSENECGPFALGTATLDVLSRLSNKGEHLLRFLPPQGRNPIPFAAHRYTIGGIGPVSMAGAVAQCHLSDIA